MADCNLLRHKLLQQQVVGSQAPGTVAPSQRWADAVVNYNILEPSDFNVPLFSEDLAKANLMGTRLALAFHSWLCGLVWPKQ